MSDGDEPADTMRERAERDPRLLYLLLKADRWLVAGLFSLGLFAALVLGGTLHPTPAQILLITGDPVNTTFQALTTGIVTAVTLVLTLSQLILSQELGAAGDQRDRMEGAMLFRDDVADAVGEPVSPTEPAAFLRSLVAATGDQARAVDEALRTDPVDENLADRITTYLDSITGNADTVTDQLTDAEFGEFDVLNAALNYNYSWKIYAGRRIVESDGDRLSAETVDALNRLTDTLALFGPAREHFKTLYFQWELSNLSRVILYAAIPALAVTIGSIAFLSPPDFPGSTLGVADSLWLLATAVTLSMTPFTLLLSYLLRIITVTKRTLAIGPFTLRGADRTVDIERE